jgi:hypothetical protein
MTSKLRFHYRDSYVRELYHDGTTCVRLPGLAKNSPALTQTATNHTGWPLSKMRGTSHYSATRTTSNIIYRDKTASHRLSICTATRKMPAESFCPPASIKNWHSRHCCLLINTTRDKLLTFIKLVPRNTTWPIFYARPVALQMVFNYMFLLDVQSFARAHFC